MGEEDNKFTELDGLPHRLSDEGSIVEEYLAILNEALIDAKSGAGNDQKQALIQSFESAIRALFPNQARPN